MIIAEYRTLRQYGKCQKWINVTRIGLLKQLCGLNSHSPSLCFITVCVRQVAPHKKN